MDNRGYITVPCEMAKEMGLNGNELLIYALIRGFCNDGESDFHGSIKYIAESINISRRAVEYNIAHLCDMGLVERKPVPGMACHYVCVDTQNLHRGCAKIAQEGTQNLHRGCAKIAHNNIIDNIEDKKRDNNTATPFNFKSSLIELGITENTVEQWLKVRKEKKAVNTELAFRALAKEIRKAPVSPEEAVQFAVINSWAAFKVEWYENAMQKRKSSGNLIRI